MKISCTLCRYEVNLDHRVFDDYMGPIKCFCCSNMMYLKTTRGRLEFINSPNVLPPPPTDVVKEPAPQNKRL